ncbi:MAG: DsbE family thiol:disulfide interchange protein [Alphaproteobacteria bacterium]|nr:DsbE family thiol:disulfide interchange protein [Alphaproteobacteria bacterium]
MRRLLFLAPLGLFLAAILAFSLGLGRDPSILPSVLINKPLPGFALAGLEAGSPGLGADDFRDGQPALLNVFGSWCVACRYEHPELLALKAQGVRIEGLDWRDDPAAARTFLAQAGDPYARVGVDATGRTAIDLGVAGAPETFVVDGQGRVRYQVVGPITPELWSRTLRPLMARLARG